MCAGVCPSTKSTISRAIKQCTRHQSHDTQACFGRRMKRRMRVCCFRIGKRSNLSAQYPQMPVRLACPKGNAFRGRRLTPTPREYIVRGETLATQHRYTTSENFDETQRTPSYHTTLQKQSTSSGRTVSISTTVW